MRPALPALALALLAAPGGPARADPPPAVLAAAERLADELGPPLAGRRALLLAVDARAAILGRVVETSLEAALASEGYAVAIHRAGDDPEAAARAAGHDWLLRVTAGLVPGRRELALVGELIPAWSSFFLQRRVGARAIPPRVVQARAAADAGTLLLAREDRPPGARFAEVRPLGQVAGRVLALAVGDVGTGRTAIVVVTPERLLVLAEDGTPLAAREAAPPEAPVRDPAAVVAVGDFGPGRIALLRAGAARAEILALAGDRLEPRGALDVAPLCAGAAGTLGGAFAPGTGVLEDRLARLGDPAPLRSGRLLYGVAAAPGGGPIAFAALGTDLALELLGPDLAPVRAAVPREALRTGSGFALADLDGDGAAELVASEPSPGGPDRLRVLSPLSASPLLLDVAPIAGTVLAGAAGDLTGDGVDDALLAAVGGEPGAAATALLLVSADPREAR